MLQRFRQACVRRRRLPQGFAAERRVLPFMAVAMVLAAALLWLPPGTALDVHATWPLLFRARALFGPGPGLDPKIKVFAYDDATVATLGRMDLALDDWALIIRALDLRRPAAIAFDKIFDKSYAPEELERFQTLATQITAPVWIDSFVSDIPIPYRTQLPPIMALPAPAGAGAAADPWPWLPVRAGFHYGAEPELLRGITGVGHVVYDNSGLVDPMRRVDAHTAIPHWVARVAPGVRMDARGLAINGHRVPLDRDGRLLANVDRPAAYAERMWSLHTLLKYARDNRPVSVIQPGDFVVILPALYTGNTDWRATPLGSMPGGSIMLALLHSALSGAWLDHRPLAGPAAAVLLVLAGGLAGGWLTPRRFWPVWLGVAVAIPAVAVAVFLLGGVCLPWVTLGLAWSLAAVGAQVATEDAARIERLRMQSELETARLVQTTLIPDRPVERPRLLVDGHYQPASECGGDFWWHYAPAPGVDYIIVADATGHGVPAALVTAMAFSACSTISNLISAGVPVPPSPRFFLETLNSCLTSTRGDQASMSAFVMCLAEIPGQAGRQITYACAGHPAPLLLPRGEGKVRRLPRARGNVLGLGADLQLQENSLTLSPGDRVVCFTDGLTEIADPAGVNWGEVRLRALISGTAVAALPPGDLKRAIVAEALAHSGPDRPLADDLTVLIVAVG